MKVELDPNWMISRKILMVFLVAAVSFIANNHTAFWIVASLIEGYMLIAYTYSIFTPSIFNYNSSKLYFRSDDWTMETRDT